MVTRANDLVRAVCEALDAFRDSGLRLHAFMEEHQFRVVFESHDCFREGVPHTITWRLENYQMSKSTAEAAFLTLRQIQKAFEESERWKFYGRVCVLFGGPIYEIDMKPIRSKIEALSEIIKGVEDG